MSSLFADTHNMVAILMKSNASEDFEQIIDFLSRSYIHYALTVNPHIYVSCIKQFRNTASVKHLDDVTRLQALVDRKKIVISEDVIREILSKVQFLKIHIFQLVRNVDSSLKFYMYPRFIQLIIQNQIGDLSTHTTRYISPALTQKVFANMRRVRKGFSRVETPLFEEDVANEAIQLPSPPSHDIPSTSQVQYSPPQQPQSSPQAPPQGAAFPTHLFQQVLDTCSTLTRHVENLEHDKAAQKLEIINLKARRLEIVKLKERVKKLE
nr:hypothetical protein [Tanacetum cinerariifolium]